MVIDAISASRQIAQQIQPQNLADQTRQSDLFRDLFKSGGASNDGAYTSGLDNPATMSERFFSRLTEMQAHHLEAVVPAERRVAATLGEDLKISDTAPPFEMDDARVARMLPVSGEFDLANADSVQSKMSIKEQMQELVSKHDEKMREILRMQFEIGRAVVEEEFLAGIAGRSTRNLDMLLRGQ